MIIFPWVRYFAVISSLFQQKHKFQNSRSTWLVVHDEQICQQSWKDFNPRLKACDCLQYRAYGIFCCFILCAAISNQVMPAVFGQPSISCALSEPCDRFWLTYWEWRLELLVSWDSFVSAGAWGTSLFLIQVTRVKINGAMCMSKLLQKNISRHFYPLISLPLILLNESCCFKLRYPYEHFRQT